MTIRRRHDIWDLAVIGGGIAGLTAAWHAMRRGLSTALFETIPGCGGQVATVESIDDWPSVAPVSGVELAAGLAGALSHEVVDRHHESVTHVSLEDGLMRVASESHRLRARRVIAASGARLRALGVDGEERLRGKGVSQCAHCDGAFFRGQDVVVAGGGDAALQEALVLAEACRSVVIVARSRLKARASFIERAASKPNVRFIWNTEVARIAGDEGVDAVELRDTHSGSTSMLSCAGVFPFVGVVPSADYLPSSVRRDASGHVVTDASCRSAEPSIFAIGALRSGYGGDLVNAAADAQLAVRAVARDLQK